MIQAPGPDSYNLVEPSLHVENVFPCLTFPSLFPRGPDAQALGRRQLPRVAVLLLAKLFPRKESVKLSSSSSVIRQLSSIFYLFCFTYRDTNR
jgi:hypothetical protein